MADEDDDDVTFYTMPPKHKWVMGYSVPVQSIRWVVRDGEKILQFGLKEVEYGDTGPLSEKIVWYDVPVEDETE